MFITNISVGTLVKITKQGHPYQNKIGELISIMPPAVLCPCPNIGVIQFNNGDTTNVELVAENIEIMDKRD